MERPFPLLVRPPAVGPLSGVLVGTLLVHPGDWTRHRRCMTGAGMVGSGAAGTPVGVCGGRYGWLRLARSVLGCPGD